VFGLDIEKTVEKLKKSFGTMVNEISGLKKSNAELKKGCQQFKKEIEIL